MEAVRQQRSLTVFVWSEQTFPSYHNDVALDEAYLGLASGALLRTYLRRKARLPSSQPARNRSLRLHPPARPGSRWTADANLRLRATIYGAPLAVDFPPEHPLRCWAEARIATGSLVEYNGQQGGVASWMGVYSDSFDALPEVTP